LQPREGELFTYLTKHLGMEPPNAAVPFYLATTVPNPGSFTIQASAGKPGLCVTGARERPGAMLYDAIFHETLHLLNLERSGAANVVVELKRRLLRNGFANTDLVPRTAPHLLVFIHIGETIRRFIDASYRLNAGIFALPGNKAIADIERTSWAAYLSGRMSRDEALDQMVSELVRARLNPGVHSP
jgi:hypothetical protein